MDIAGHSSFIQCFDLENLVDAGYYFLLESCIEVREASKHVTINLLQVHAAQSSISSILIPNHSLNQQHIPLKDEVKRRPHQSNRNRIMPSLPIPSPERKKNR
ncbi:MAG: hypothetical protein Q9181_003348 [Wetmoreana brouardii]